MKAKVSASNKPSLLGDTNVNEIAELVNAVHEFEFVLITNMHLCGVGNV